MALSDILTDTNNAIRVQLLRYLFSQFSQADFIRHVGTDAVSRKEARRLIVAAQESGYILKNCKLYAFYYHVHQSGRPEDFGVERQDVSVLRRLDLTFKHAVRPMTLDRFDEIASRLLSCTELKNYMGKFITKKMSFLIKSFGWTASDLKAELQGAALYALMRQYPVFQSPLHFKNVAKTAIHNHGQTLISAQTRGKRQNLQRESDGSFSSVLVPIEPIADYVPDHVSHRTQVHEDLQAIVKMSTHFSLKVKDFLTCMAGEHHAGFSEYLNRDNSEAVDSMRYDLYRGRLEKYLNVSRDQTDALLSHIKENL